jgi:hypothetical protein
MKTRRVLLSVLMGVTMTVPGQGLCSAAEAEEAVTGEAPPAEVEATSPAPEVTEEASSAVAESAPAETAPAVTEPEPEPEPEPATGIAEPAATDPHVAVATFTSDIVEREPVDNITFLKNDQDRIIFFTDLRNLKGQTVTHRWERGGEILATVPFDIGGDRWRVWSSKDLRPEWHGEWKVSVVDQNDVVIATRTFTYTDSGAPPDLAP